MNDTRIDAKEFLSQAYRIDQRINAKLEQVAHLRALARRVTVSYGQEAVDRTRNVGSMEDTIHKIILAERMWMRRSTCCWRRRRRSRA